MTPDHGAGIDPWVLREFAEHPILHMTWAGGGKITRHVCERMCVVVAPTFGIVTSVDAAPRDVSSLLDEVRELIPAGVRTYWYLGPSTRPTGLAETLLTFGLFEPEGSSGTLHALLLEHEPSGVSAHVETHEVATISDFAAAAEVRWQAFGLTDEEREYERGFLVTYYQEYLQVKDRSTIAFVATLDGRVAGSANALLSDRGLFLFGGATAPWARRRGVYRALVDARWHYAVGRGTPALAVHAIPDTSSPALRRMGFDGVCPVRHLEGRPT